VNGWFKVKAGAKYADCSERLFREWFKRGLRHVRVKGTIRTKPEWIDSFLGKNEVIHQSQTVNEITEDVCKGFL